MTSHLIVLQNVFLYRQLISQCNNYEYQKNKKNKNTSKTLVEKYFNRT